MAFTTNTPKNLSASSTGSYDGDVAMLDSTHFVQVYVNTSNQYVYAVIGTISSNAITYGTPQYISLSAGTQQPVVAALSSSAFIIGFFTNDGFLDAAVVAGTVSGTTITLGTKSTLGLSLSSPVGSIVALSSTLFVFGFSSSGTNNYYIAGTVSGTTITLGSYVQPSGGIGRPALAAMGSTHFVTATVNSSGGYLYVQAGSVSGTTITIGTAVAFNSNSDQYYRPAIMSLTSTTFITSVYFSDNAQFLLYDGSISGTTVSVGSTTGSYTPSAGGTQTHTLCYISSTTFGLCYTQSSSVVATIPFTYTSGSSITAGTVATTTTNNASVAIWSTPNSSTQFVMGWVDTADSYIYSVTVTVSVSTPNKGFFMH